MIVTPDTRRPKRVTPTMHEQEIVDYYAEGYTHRYIESKTGMAMQKQKHMLARLQIPLARESSRGGHPRLMTDAEMLRGGELMDAHIAISERRTWDTEREVAETMARATEEAERAA